ncbi:MAG: amidohydrolase family protein, partial [Armatimonadota bacterium]
VQMGRYAEKHPDLNIIPAHAAHTDYIAAARVAAAHDNIYLDFCCEWPGSGKIRRAIEICGAEKIVFGTDMDLLEPSFTRGMFEEAGLSGDEQRLIYRTNAMRLLKFSEQMHD